MLDVWRFAEGDPWDLRVEAPGLGAARLGAAPRPLRPARLRASQRRTELAQRRLDEADPACGTPTACRCRSLPRLGAAAARRRRRAHARRRAERPLPADDPDHRRAAVAARALGRRGLHRTRSGKNAFITISCDEAAARSRAPRSSSASSGCTWSARRERRERSAVDLRPLEAVAAPAGLPRLRRQPQAHPGLDPRAAAQPAEVVHRGLPRGRRRPLGHEAREGSPSRVLDRLTTS